MTAKWLWALEKRAQCYAAKAGKKKSANSRFFFDARRFCFFGALFLALSARACEHKKSAGAQLSITLLRSEVTLPTSENK
jgi:hypothetical protein